MLSGLPTGHCPSIEMYQSVDQSVFFVNSVTFVHFIPRLSYFLNTARL